MSSVVVIGDSHQLPDTPMDHWSELGEFLVSFQPDHLVHVGDWADFASKAFRKDRRGKLTTDQELKAVKDALELLYTPLRKYNDSRRELGFEPYRPKMHTTMGNHDIPELKELLESHGWEVKEAGELLEIDDVYYSHTFPRANSNYVCTSCEEILDNTLVNTVSGHGHIRQYFERYSVKSERTWAMKVPVFRRDKPKWAGVSATKWSHGFSIVIDGQFRMWKDIEHE